VIVRNKPRRRLCLNLRWHKASRQFYKYVGRYIGPHGKVRPKLHYLGASADDALSKLDDIKRRWREIRNAGLKLWPPDEVHTVQSADFAVAPAAPPPVIVADAATELRW
jgi:hypothetical protein